MTDEETLDDLSHTNPYTGRPFGETQSYARGQTIAADGGESDAVDEMDATEDMSDVDHTPPGDAPSVNEVYDRADGPER